jgi:hypothetical protein
MSFADHKSRPQSTPVKPSQTYQPTHLTVWPSRRAMAFALILPAPNQSMQSKEVN